MADNYQVRDGSGALVTVKSKDIGAGLQLMQSVSSDATGTPYDASNPLPLTVPNYAAEIASNSLSRPADTNIYASGDLVADNVTAGSVTPFSFAGAVRAVGGVARIERVRMLKSSAGLTNAQFRVHFFNAAPQSLQAGDNGVLSCAKAGYVGFADVTLTQAFTDGAQGSGVPSTFTPITYKIAVGTTLYALIEARGAYTPVSGETLQLQIENFRF